MHIMVNNNESKVMELWYDIDTGSALHIQSQAYIFFSEVILYGLSTIFSVIHVTFH